MGARVLMIDDSKALGKLVGRELGRHGIHVEMALTGNEGIRLASEMKPDLILLDVNLPDMDGLLAAHLLRSSAETRNIPVIAISGEAATDLDAEAQRTGCLEFIRKPFSMEDLAARVTALVETRRRASR